MDSKPTPTMEGLTEWKPDIYPLMLILVPTTGEVSTRTANWLRVQERLDDRNRIAMMMQARQRGEEIPETLKWPQIEYRIFEHEMPGYVEDVRQVMTDYFLETGCEWLIMLDSDTQPHLPAALILEGAIANNLKLVVGPTPFAKARSAVRGVMANVSLKSEDGQPKPIRYHDLPWGSDQRYHEIDPIGIGCALIHRSVLETLTEQAEATGEYPWRARWERGRVRISEDMAFWEKCKAAGFRVFADMENPCSHRHVALYDANAAVDQIKFWEPGGQPNPDAPYHDVLSPRPIWSAGRKPEGPEKAETDRQQEAIERAAQPSGRVPGQIGCEFVVG